MSFLSQCLFAIAIIAAIFAVILRLRGQTLAARHAMRRAMIVMAGSATLALAFEMYLRGSRTP